MGEPGTPQPSGRGRRKKRPQWKWGPGGFILGGGGLIWTEDFQKGGKRSKGNKRGRRNDQKQLIGKKKREILTV